MEFDPDDFEGQSEHRSTIFMIARFLEQAAAAASFEDAGRPLSDALSCHAGACKRKYRPLSDVDLEQLLERIEWVLGQSSQWGRHPYSQVVGEGLEAFAEQLMRWNGQTVDTPQLDTNQRSRILRNAAHNAGMTKEINERVHARRNRRVVSFLEYRNSRLHS